MLVYVLLTDCFNRAVCRASAAIYTFVSGDLVFTVTGLFRCANGANTGTCATAYASVCINFKSHA